MADQTRFWLYLLSIDFRLEQILFPNELPTPVVGLLLMYVLSKRRLALKGCLCLSLRRNSSQ